ncbi:MAG TPA: hypothetical protein VGL46_03220 [Pseudonocardiaceae bacterium]|jgi:hypothetical protein
MTKAFSPKKSNTREQSGRNSAGAGHTSGSALTIRRSRGLITGLLLALLGLWGAIVPFVGPYFNYAFGIANPWFFTTDRLWLNIMPGIAVALGGLMLGSSTSRGNSGCGAWLALLGGIWFTIGPVLAQLWNAGGTSVPIGEPLGATPMQVLEQLGYFHGLGALVIALAAFTLGRLSLRST